jgi:hypothetical protein
MEKHKVYELEREGGECIQFSRINLRGNWPAGKHKIG